MSVPDGHCTSLWEGLTRTESKTAMSTIERDEAANVTLNPLKCKFNKATTVEPLYSGQAWDISKCPD